MITDTKTENPRLGTISGFLCHAIFEIRAFAELVTHRLSGGTSPNYFDTDAAMAFAKKHGTKNSAEISRNAENFVNNPPK